MITSEKLALRLTKSIKPLQWGNCMVEMTLKSKCYSSSKANTQKIVFLFLAFTTLI